MKDKIYVYCNPSMLDFIQPLEVSKIILQEYNNTCIALYDKKTLESKTEEEWEELDKKIWNDVSIWYRGCEWWANIDIEDYKPRIMRKEWLHNFICDTYWASQPRNVAAIISQFSIWERKNPIEFYNSL